jgi:hypothetical protein
LLIEDFRTEFDRYRVLGERAIAQVSDEALNVVPAHEGNSMAMVVRHVSGNLISRFTGFLITDGEKPDRDRDSEFETRSYSRSEVDELWRRAWSTLERELAALTDSHLDRTVTIRRQPLTVHAALSRSLAHISYHVGQLVLLGRMHAGEGWESLSIPKGHSASYNQSPTLEKSSRSQRTPD